MENISHTLSGLVLARLGADRHGPWATALLVTAANFPDVDCVSLFFDQQTYLRWHHGITHSIFGIALAGPLLGFVFCKLASRRNPEARFSTFTWLAYAGLLMHAFLDVLLSYGMRPWLPFDGTWYYADVIHVADPWVWVMLGAGAILGGRSRGGGLVAWILFAVATTAVAYAAYRTGRAPIEATWGLGVLWLLILSIRAAGIGEGRRKLFARTSLFFFGLYVVLLFFAGRANHARGVADLTKVHKLRHARIETTSTVPRACLPWMHRIVVQTPNTLYRVDLSLFSSEVERDVLPRNLRDPALSSIAHRREYETWKQFARHPFTGRNGRKLILGEARYHWAVEESWCNLAVEIR